MSNHTQISNGHLSNIKASIDALVAAGSNSDDVETILTSIDGRLDSTIGHLNNLTDLGSGSDAVKTASIGMMPSGNGRILSCSADGKLDVDNTNFGKLTTIDTRLDNTIGAINNLSSLGAGSDALKTASLAVMSGGNARILSCSNDGDLNVNLVSGAITGFATETTLGSIKTAVELLDNCVAGSELQVDIVGGGFDGVVSGAVVATLSTADKAALDSIQTAVELIDDCVSGTELQVDIVGGGFDGVVSGAVVATLSATDNAVLDSIATAVQLLDDCVDTAHLNVNLNIQGGDVDSSSGNLSVKTQRICLATDDIPTAAVNANLVLLEATLETIKVDTEAIETAVESVAGCVSGTELQVDIVSGGGNATARLDIATGAAELADNELSTAVDCSAFSEICVAYPTTKTNNQLKLFVKGSTTTGGTYYTFANMVRKEFNATDSGSGDTQHYVWGTGQDQYNAGFIPCVYPFIKIENQSNESFADSDNIRIVGR